MAIPMKRHSYRGKLIAFCGVDGAGKSTLLDEAKRQLALAGIDYYATKMPSQRIRQMPIFSDYHHSHDDTIRRSISALALTILVSGDRLIVQETEVIPALERGQWVLTDRYVFSGLACSDSPVIRRIASEFLEPDLVVLASARPDTIRTRVMAREAERGLYYDDADTRTKLARFASLANEHPFFVTIDTEQPFATVHDQLRRELMRLGMRAHGPDTHDCVP